MLECLYCTLYQNSAEVILDILNWNKVSETSAELCLLL